MLNHRRVSPESHCRASQQRHQGGSLSEDTEFGEEAVDLEGMGSKLGGDVGDAGYP
jgi:hypothetical protein